MKVLFIPNDSGGGLGHISMCSSLAQQAKARGHECAFLLSEGKYVPLLSQEYRVLVSSAYMGKAKRIVAAVIGAYRSRTPLYTEISNIDYLVLRDGLGSDRILGKRVIHYLGAIKKYRPHVLVGDTDICSRIVSRISGLPLVQIVRYISHPQTARVIWWKEEDPELKPPESLGLFNAYFKKIGLPEIAATKELLEGDLYLVPSIPEIEPILASEKTHFVGALLQEKDRNPLQKKEMVTDDLNPLIYMTIGGGAGPVGNRSLFETAIRAFSTLPLRLVISTGNKFPSRSFTSLPSNVSIFEWLPGGMTISRAHMIISHGGYATMMESLFHAKPSLIIPFHSEQEGNGRRLQQLGCAQVLKLSGQEYRAIEGHWKYGKYNYLIQDRYDLTPRELRESVLKIINNKKYFENAKKLQERILTYGGADMAVQIIERHVS